MSTTRRTAPVARPRTPDPIARPRTPDPVRTRHRGRAVALLALALVVSGVIAVALAATRGSPRHASTTEARVQRNVAARSPRHRPARAPAATSTTTASTSSSTTTTSAAPSASQLQLTGHDEMLRGDYQTAIGTLREAVSSSDPGSLTYAYALYDLGRSLVLGGDPSGAIPVLQERLKIPNQTPVVRQMLNQALHATGQASPPPANRTRPTPGRGGHGQSPGRPTGKAAPTGGAGLAPTPSHGQRHADGRAVPDVTVLAD